MEKKKVYFSEGNEDLKMFKRQEIFRSGLTDKLQKACHYMTIIIIVRGNYEQSNRGRNYKAIH